MHSLYYLSSNPDLIIHSHWVCSVFSSTKWVQWPLSDMPHKIQSQSAKWLAVTLKLDKKIAKHWGEMELQDMSAVGAKAFLDSMNTSFQKVRDSVAISPAEKTMVENIHRLLTRLACAPHPSFLLMRTPGGSRHGSPSWVPALTREPCPECLAPYFFPLFMAFVEKNHRMETLWICVFLPPCLCCLNKQITSSS